jgi:hypothetical protein
MAFRIPITASLGSGSWSALILARVCQREPPDSERTQSRRHRAMRSGDDLLRSRRGACGPSPGDAWSVIHRSLQQDSREQLADAMWTPSAAARVRRSRARPSDARCRCLLSDGRPRARSCLSPDRWRGRLAFRCEHQRGPAAATEARHDGHHEHQHRRACPLSVGLCDGASVASGP